MSDVIESLEEFLEYAAILKGDEKGEAQVFCDLCVANIRFCSIGGEGRQGSVVM